MPTYEYECPKCGERFDKFQSMKDDPKADCPKCKHPAHRLISGGSGIIFKGSGFYETDYKKKKPENAPSCPSASEACKGCPSNKDKR